MRTLKKHVFYQEDEVVYQIVASAGKLFFYRRKIFIFCKIKKMFHKEFFQKEDRKVERGHLKFLNKYNCLFIWRKKMALCKHTFFIFINFFFCVLTAAMQAIFVEKGFPEGDSCKNKCTKFSAIVTFALCRTIKLKVFFFVSIGLNPFCFKAMLRTIG